MYRYFSRLILINIIFLLSGCHSNISNFNIPQFVKPNDGGILQINIQDTKGFNFGSYSLRVERKNSKGDFVREKPLYSTAYGTSSTFQFLGALPPGNYRVIDVIFHGGGYTHYLNMTLLGEFEIQKGKLTHLGTLFKSDDSEQVSYGIGSSSVFFWGHKACSQDLVCDKQANNKSLLKQYFPKFMSLLTEPEGYLTWTRLSKRVATLKFIRQEYLKVDNLSLSKDGFFYYGKAGLLFDAKNKIQLETNTTTEIIAAVKLKNSSYLFSSELGGLFHSNNKKLSLINPPLNTGRIVNLSKTGNIITAVHLERGVFRIFQTQIGSWNLWQERFQFKNSLNSFLVTDRASEFEKLNSFFVSEDNNNIYISYLNNVFVVFDKHSGKAILNEYKFDIEDVYKGDNDLINVAEPYSVLRMGRLIHISRDLGKTWKTIKNLNTKIAPIQGENNKFYTLFFDEHDEKIDWLVETVDFESWKKIDDHSNICSQFTHNEMVKLKMTKCLPVFNVQF